MRGFIGGFCLILQKVEKPTQMRKQTERVYLKILQKEVERTFGTPLQTPTNFQTCIHAILENTHKNISVSTLKRIFGYVPAGDDYLPSMSILNILAEYTGYENYHDFCIHHNHTLQQQGELDLEELVRNTAAHLECAQRALNMLCHKLGINIGQTPGAGGEFTPPIWGRNGLRTRING